MPLTPARVFGSVAFWRKMKGRALNDEELGKKDDDHKIASKKAGLGTSGWHAARGPPRRTLKRIALAAIVGFLIYLFIHNIPTDLGPAITNRPKYGSQESSNDGRRNRPRPPPDLKQYAPQSQPPPPAKVVEDHAEIVQPSTSPSAALPVERTYNAPPRFLELASSLHAITGTSGLMTLNRNILFAASSLKSAGILLPIACSMGAELKNYVHFALMSRSEIGMEQLREINGIDDGCQIIFHDARPEYANISTDERMERSNFRAFHHIHSYMHPQAIIIDRSEKEESFFLKAARAHTMATFDTLIELPERSASSLMWITKLDSASLHAWSEAHVDILVQASSMASGSLIRLLRSLRSADYTASSVPHLTIELPNEVDSATTSFLETFKWPPSYVPNPTNLRLLTLRHRIPHTRLDEEESSVRFLESFWPANPRMNHILVLSPQVELSPDFFQYLRYSLLEYRYSTIARKQHWDAHLLGLSLEHSFMQLNGNKLSLSAGLEDDERAATASFLWQAPTSNAMLFLGDRWVELHDFVSRCLEVQLSSSNVPSLLSEKVISTDYPSWLEHVLRLSRARGYWTLYPGEDIASVVATVHRELAHLPEEYDLSEEAEIALSDDATEEEIEKAAKKSLEGHEISLSSVSLLQALPNKGALQSFGELPLLSWDGHQINFRKLEMDAGEYSHLFKKHVGGCTEEENAMKKVALSAQDLFCETA